MSPKTERIVIESGYFHEVYKMTKVQEDGIQNGENTKFTLGLSWFWKLIDFLKKSQSLLVVRPNAKCFAAGFLNYV